MAEGRVQFPGGALTEVTSHGVEVMATNRFPSPEESVRFVPALLRMKQEHELVAKLERRLVATQEIPGSSPGGLSTSGSTTKHE